MCKYNNWYNIFLISLLLIIISIVNCQADNNNRYDIYFIKYSKMYFGSNFNYKLFKSQALAESNLNSTIKSSSGAIGVMQIMPATWKQICKQQRITANITNPRWNIAAGIYYDRYLWTQWSSKRTNIDRICLMFASYNAGLGTILTSQQLCVSNSDNINVDCNSWNNIKKYNHNRWRQQETLQYIDNIFMFFKNL